MADAKTFVKERYADLMPIIEAAIALEPGGQVVAACHEKSPHTVGQKIREFFKLAAEQRPDLGIEYGQYSVTVLGESRRVVIKKKKGLSYGAVLLTEE